MEIEIAKHLGGHLDITNTDKNILEFIKDKFNIKTMLDIGCGPGGMQPLAEELNIHWTGLDGDPNVINESIILHDFVEGKYNTKNDYDLVWSTEFLEHVEEKYMKNYMPLFARGKIAVVTAAAPGTPGHYHVNCQSKDYWIDKFEDYGFRYSTSLTEQCKDISIMRKKFFKRTGMVFIK